MADVETLECNNCHTSWHRERKRGRKPRVCPECQNATQRGPAIDRGIPEPKQPQDPIKTSFCSAKLHIMCAEAMERFPEAHPACSCKCHNT